MDADRDAKLEAARYRAEQAAREAGFAEPDEAPAEPRGTAGTPTAADRAMYVETAIQQAIRRGDFDDLPGAGKPLEGLGTHHDPDWWIRRKIQTEQLTGLGPPALLLRTEHAEFDERVDALTREEQVREYVDDFNRRVVDARRQLQGGPPVVTPLRDVDAEVAAWRARRAPTSTPAPATPPPPRRRWFRRR
ncbi:DnaJ family domain-containing protein [Microbacterium sp. bgisy189]|uniref:DnaJ family domain-containing protein n=1 Tax=Microbacterium sp. bgisy189 TaxID=3413798 RepID=UPI003EBF3BE4